MSAYSVYRLRFSTGAHFGNGMLNMSAPVFSADVLFSALYIEALKAGCEESFFRAVNDGGLRFSDALPYRGDVYYLPKPMLRIQGMDSGDSAEKKFYKNLKYIPAEKFEAYLEGKMDRVDTLQGAFSITVRTMAAVRKEEDTLPYQVGVCSYEEGAGLYLVVKYDTEEELRLFEELLDMVSSVGIGGKRSAGLGKFSMTKVTRGTDALIRKMGKDGRTFMLLSTALPSEEEMEKALEGASYMLVPRSGFVFSETYAHEQRKRQTLFVMEQGSCFAYPFHGDIYDVSEGSGKHPVFRYAKPLFMAF